MSQPKVIFLDAVGTLFGVRGSVGSVYQAIAQPFGVEVSATALDQAFRQSFRDAKAPAFLNGNPTDSPLANIPAKEFAWWLAIVTQTFEQAGVLHQFSDFAAFFAKLYAHFASAEPWVVYSDVRPALKQWKQQGVTLGVLSNFDSRLYAVLQALELANFFSSITLSTETGAAKPDSRIFAAALQKHSCSPAEAWHVGDSFKEDYQAACAVGIRGIWLRRGVG